MNKLFEKYCNACGSFKDCAYRLRNLERKCPQLSDFEYGVECGVNDVIEKIRAKVKNFDNEKPCGRRYSADVLDFLSNLEKEYEQ